jgi:hypothetical protein
VTRLVRVGSWLSAAGTVILSALTRSVPVLIYATAGEIALCLCFLAWILCDDRRVERLNVLFRGGKLSSVQREEIATELDRGEPAEEEPARPAADSPIDPQARVYLAQLRTYIAQLRKTGKADLADELERALSSDAEKGLSLRARSEGGLT